MGKNKAVFRNGNQSYEDGNTLNSALNINCSSDNGKCNIHTRCNMHRVSVREIDVVAWCCARHFTNRLFAIQQETEAPESGRK
jgi:hypothetical protein